MIKIFLFNPSKLQILCIVCKHKVLSALNKLTVLLSERKKWFLPWLVYVWNTGGCTEMCSTYFVCGISLAFCVWFCCMNWNEEVRQKQKKIQIILHIVVVVLRVCLILIHVWITLPDMVWKIRFPDLFDRNTCIKTPCTDFVTIEQPKPWFGLDYKNFLHWFDINSPNTSGLSWIMKTYCSGLIAKKQLSFGMNCKKTYCTGLIVHVV